MRLIGAVLLEANDEWQLQHRYMQTEAMAELIQPTIDAVPTTIATHSRVIRDHLNYTAFYTSLTDATWSRTCCRYAGAPSGGTAPRSAPASCR